MINVISYLIFQTIIIFIIAAFFIASGYYNAINKKTFSREVKISYVCEKIGITLLIAFIVNLITYGLIK